MINLNDETGETFRINLVNKHAWMRILNVNIAIPWGQPDLEGLTGTNLSGPAFLNFLKIF